MLVSVIIPTYNREKTIGRAIESVLSQTWKSIELIIVDDGSSDHTLNLLSSYGDRIRVIRQRNQGPSAARNTGINASHGEVIAFLDSDDSWLPNKVERQVELLEKTAEKGVGCCVCNAMMIYADSRTITSFAVAELTAHQMEGVWLNPAEILATRFLFFNQVVAVRRDWLDRAGFFRKDLRILEDYDLSLRLALVGPWAFIAEPLVIWHGGEENSLSKSVNATDSEVRVHDILLSFRKNYHANRLFPTARIDRRLAYLKRQIWARKQTLKSNPCMLLIGFTLLLFLRCSKFLDARFLSQPTMITENA